MVTLAKRELALDEEDAVPLVRTATATATSLSSSNHTIPYSYRGRAILAFVVASFFAVLFVYKTDAGATAADVVKKAAASRSSRFPSRSSACEGLCTVREKQRAEHWNGDLLNSTDLLRLVADARRNMVSTLQKQYGVQYYKNMFEFKGNSRGRLALHGADGDSTLSIQRFKRKLKLKILGMQTAILDEDQNVDGCECSPVVNHGDDQTRARSLLDQETETTPPPTFPDSYSEFVWVTGGHSAAAGHGNLFNESMTAFMERTVENVFASVGVGFTARNYAMGGTPSGPEIALCQEPIFGTDADVITWDFGMMEATDYWRKYFYANRAGLNPGRPTVVDIHLEGRMMKGRIEQLAKVERNGMSALYVDPSHTDAMRAALPDMFGMTTQDIEALPEFVKYHKCNNQFEKGDPFCGDFKYSKEHCPERRGRAGWHPGWKEHALFGNIMALFLADSLLDATTELVETNADPRTLLSTLQAEEDADFKQFYESVIPEPLEETGEDIINEVNATILFRSPSVCHTARLPAEARYYGIVTESDKLGMESFDMGVLRRDADKVDPSQRDKGEMPLTYDAREANECDGLTVDIDYKDYFFNRAGYGWRSLTFPNSAETKAYTPDGWNPKGVIVLCWGVCAWGRCVPGELKQEGVYEGKLKMEVNGAPVVNVTDWVGDCAFLRGEGGHIFKPDVDGKFVLKTLVDINATDPKNSFTKISSVIAL